MPMSEEIRLASRRSRLALAQSGVVAQQLSELTGRPVRIVEVVSEGDRSHAPLTQIGGTGVFVAAVRAALRDGTADVAVHSLKDLPTAPAPDITLAAIPRRADPRDVVCAAGATLAELPEGARVGTGSPRRVAQLALARPDLQMVDIRGNLDTRLRRVGDDLAAVVVAAAGIARLGVQDAAQPEPLPVETMLPAPGQGALAIEVAADVDAGLMAALQQLDDPATRAAVTAEREMLAALEAGCSAPVGALALTDEPSYWEPEVYLRGGIFTRESSVRMSVTGAASAAVELGRELASRLLAAGGTGLLSESMK